MIQGIVSASAPMYDAGMEGLVEESSVRALEASVEGEKEAKERVEDDRAKEIAEVVAGEVLKFCSSSRPSSSGTGVRMEDLQPSLTSLATPRNTALSTFTPHHGAHFLAASAPGSRLGSRAASPSDLRSISSHAGLARLGAIKGQIKCLGGRVSEADTVAEDTSPSISHPSSSSVGYLFGLGDHALTAGELPSPIELSGGVRMAPCAIHGEKCDGITTTEPWLTERTMRGNGFLEEVPMLESEGRVMVDWAELLDEEKVVGGR